MDSDAPLADVKTHSVYANLHVYMLNCTAPTHPAIDCGLGVQHLSSARLPRLLPHAATLPHAGSRRAAPAVLRAGPPAVERLFNHSKSADAQIERHLNQPCHTEEVLSKPLDQASRLPAGLQTRHGEKL